MDADLILVGGGLANTLIASRLRAEQPQLKLLMLERDDTLGGNHTWCFHGTDVNENQRNWLQEFVVKDWAQHRIAFPHLDRCVAGSYHAITAEQLHRVATEQFGDAVVTGVEVTEVGPEAVSLADGRRFTAPAVVDGRGDPGGKDLDVRFQKFLGLVLELEAPCGLDVPLLMDGRVPQLDGFRFMYSLPFGPRQVLVEDTRYSDTPDLERESMRAAIVEYAAGRGWRVARVLREEEGALPVVLGGDLKAYWQAAPGVPIAGQIEPSDRRQHDRRAATAGRLDHREVLGATAKQVQ